jgi:hypothetical protein
VAGSRRYRAIDNPPGKQVEHDREVHPAFPLCARLGETNRNPQPRVVPGFRTFVPVHRTFAASQLPSTTCLAGYDDGHMELWDAKTLTARQTSLDVTR